MLFDIGICPPAGDAMTFLQMQHDRTQVVAETILPVSFVGSLGHAPILQEMPLNEIVGKVYLAASTMRNAIGLK